MFNCALSLLDSFNNLVEKDEIQELYLAGIHLISDRNTTNNRYSCDTTSGNQLSLIDELSYNEISVVSANLLYALQTGIYYDRFMNASEHIRNNIRLNEISYVVNKLEKVSPTAINNIDEELQKVQVLIK